MKIEVALPVIGRSFVVHKLNVPLTLGPVNWLPPCRRKERPSYSGLTVQEWCLSFQVFPLYLNFKRRIKSPLQFAGIIMSSLFSTRFQGKS